MISVRPAKKSEVVVLQKLNQEVFLHDQEFASDLDMTWALGPKGKKYFTQLVTNPKACCLIAKDDYRPVGYIAAAPKDINYSRSKYFEINNMGVSPDYRSRGVGSQLMRACLAWAKKQGFQKAYVNAYFQNSGAVKFYKKNGFSEIDVGLERLV
ncbi:GNAT family N-acetyltransferase [Candidatus Microgenomates bacterium]|nr:GNAT family N-acetyltransferase [Candidatus Microgenomates bacterium]